MMVLFQLGIWLSGSSLDDSQAWPRHMTVDEIRNALTEQAQGWSICTDALDGTVAVEAEFSKQGAITNLVLGTGVDSCWGANLRNLNLSPQQEPDLQIRFAMLTQQGRVISFAQVEKVRRSQLPAFVHLPLGLTNSERIAILQALGLAESAVAE